MLNLRNYTCNCKVAKQSNENVGGKNGLMGFVLHVWASGICAENEEMKSTSK